MLRGEAEREDEAGDPSLSFGTTLTPTRWGSDVFFPTIGFSANKILALHSSWMYSSTAV